MSTPRDNTLIKKYLEKRDKLYGRLLQLALEFVDAYLQHFDLKDT